ncbi:MAG: 2,3-bisphosphoglycerate-independent phosphoglycerate mutase [Chitinophagales bacterium]|nr:2,3-bisphosphoglycerate-independent phosphoglycerate mutase [Bacteroidota bacterium]MCB9042531.1 2,3-bisphosphoglycerate-independent phosphoglycerate mutase [Chitinophagales bacterium]
MYQNDKVALIILDGWGHGQVRKADAIANAHTPFVSSLYHQYPNSELVTFGKQVGLPQDQMGNSEVGHMNLGAGRIVYQDLLRIDVAIENNELVHAKTFQNLVAHAKQHNKPIHLVGLVSDGGVHSHIEHLKYLCKKLSENGVSQVFVHAITDGRDTDPKSGEHFIADLENYIQPLSAEIASICGRYYAMDRDKRWERIKKAYDLYVSATGEKTQNPVAAIQQSYANGVTDEFILPIVCTDDSGKPKATIQDGDVVLCFNFRTDRCREITQVLSQTDFPEFGMKKLDLYYVTMTTYDKSFQNVHVIFDDSNLKNTLGEVLEQQHKTQLRAAETEKYPHVTFFFSGGKETPFVGEQRILIPSPKVATYDLQPEMSAPPLADAVTDFLQKNKPNFVCLNFANPDMVGHTGDWNAVKKAVETTDACAEKVVNKALALGYSIFILADHGNADFLVNEDGTPNTAHSKNPVPCFFIDKNYKPHLKNGKLGDLAPTILHLMHIPIPAEMNGENLLAD